MAKIRQRYRLYRAEGAAAKHYRWFASVEAARFWLKRTIARTWYRKNSPIRHVELEYPTFGTMAGGVTDGDKLTIYVPADGLYVQLLLHELAHPIAGFSPGNSPDDHEKDHGPRFAGVLIEVYRRLFSADAAKDLIRAFEEYGVRWKPFE